MLRADARGCRWAGFGFPLPLQHWSSGVGSRASKKISIAQGNAMLARKFSEVISEEQRRNLANRSVSAQERSAAAASFSGSS
jgi:hypothetical protein